ncbi:DUF4287 domain-containing protein [Candidatus Acetothermia bacterium]|nr:DUF4287 domain-containing protein [Candidatus Acetothermia bacterium]MBI3643946.1 DUF4287 domain-containing protein [Candidatus Acetothermia bacterium]
MRAKVDPKNNIKLYSVHPSIAYIQSIIDNLSQKTGKNLDEWITLLKKSGLKGERERREWLKKSHKLGGTTTWIIAFHAEGKGTEETDPDLYLEAAVAYVEEMYNGPKAALRPIHDELIKLGKSLSKDVKISPCKTIVPFYRNHVFAQIKPATQKRIDFGLCLRGVDKKLPKRLIDTGGLKSDDRITHKFEITQMDDIDAEVKEWLKIAYELDK